MKDRDLFITPEQAKEQGLDVDEIPKRTCEYCGRELMPLGVFDWRNRVRWITSSPCDCDGYKQFLAEEEARKQREEKERTMHLLRRAGIAKRYLEAQVDNPDVIDYINNFASAKGQGLYIQGSVGAGKTYLASALAKAFVLSGYSVLLITTMAMLDSISNSYNSDNEEGLERFAQCDVLVLDDIGKENANAWASSTLFQVINYRYDNMLPTIYTSQYSLKALESRMSRTKEIETAQAIVSRITQTSHVVTLASPDRRKKR